MVSENCTDCLYSEPSGLPIDLSYIIGEYKCGHENSPYFNKFVDVDKTCRLFVDSHYYFLMKDRREKIENIKDKLRGV